MFMRCNHFPFSPLDLISEELLECCRDLQAAYSNIVLLYQLYGEIMPYPIQSSADKINQISATLKTHSKILKSLNYEKH